jgi:hypothetical protein
MSFSCFRSISGIAKISQFLIKLQPGVKKFVNNEDHDIKK